MIMEEYKLLLTTSGVGSRLDELTKYTNKSLIRVGKKPAISYIIEKYSPNIEIVVTIGYYGNQVKTFLELAYPERKFTFVDVNPYTGDGSSQLFSMLCAKDHLQCPFIFQVCDTIVTDNIPEPSTNWCAGLHFDGNSSQYRTHNVANAKLIKINDKGSSRSDRIHLGICGIYDYHAFWKKSTELYNSDPLYSQWSDCHVINDLIINDITFHSIPFVSFMDIGNIEMLEKARKEITDNFYILDKIDESIFIFDKTVIKFFHDDTIVKNRVKRAKTLGSIVPEIIEVKPNFYKYNFVNGNPLSTSVNTVNFNQLLNWSKKNLWTFIKSTSDAHDCCKEFYFKKTENRIKKFLSNSNIKDTTHIINGITVPSAIDMLKSIPFSLLCTGDMYNFHGDFILENIIYNNGNFTLIDWRQDFGGSLEGGDIYYDLSKLNHNLTFNHDVANSKLFQIDIKGNNVTCDIMRNNMMVECQHILYEYLKANNLSTLKVDLLTPIIWLNMSPLHEYPINTFLFFFGKYHLAKILSNIH